MQKPQTASAGGATHLHLFALQHPQTLHVSDVEGHHLLFRTGDSDPPVCQTSRQLAEHQAHNLGRDLTEVTIPVGKQTYEPENWRKSYLFDPTDSKPRNPTAAQIFRLTSAPSAQPPASQCRCRCLCCTVAPSHNRPSSPPERWTDRPQRLLCRYTENAAPIAHLQ